MEIIMPKYWPLQYDMVPLKMEGELTYIGDFDCGDYLPLAVWHAAKPNLEKKHKEFMMLFIQDGRLTVTGRDRSQIEKYLKRSAAHCLKCDNVIYSLYRHDYRPCKCENIAVDGGSDYFKMSFAKDAKFVTGTLDLETKEFVPFEKAKEEPNVEEIAVKPKPARAKRVRK